MIEKDPIWLEVLKKDPESGQKQTEKDQLDHKWQAQFACTISIRSAEELDLLKWGWNYASLMEESISRLRLFIESQHFKYEAGMHEPSNLKTLALRCISNPASSQLQLSLIAKTTAPTEPQARDRAFLYWKEIKSTFPYDYLLFPAANKEDFIKVSGWNTLMKANQPYSFAEIQRYENIIRTGKQRFYFLGSWRFSNSANEQIWRVLAGSGQQVMLEILLQPTVLKINEQATINELAKSTKEISETSDLITVQPYADIAAKNFEQLKNLQWYPYITQIRMVSPGGLSQYIPRITGIALTHNPEREQLSPGFQVIIPQDESEVNSWRTQMQWLDLSLEQGRFANENISRVRKMVDLNDAIALFRLPFPPKLGIPNVEFIQE